MGRITIDRLAEMTMKGLEEVKYVLRDEFRSEINALDKKLSAKFDSLDQKIDHRFNAVSNRIEGCFWDAVGLLAI